ncbi:DNA replication and repair protein RecF [Rhodospirillaceae bacterium LM-1]|nr:DNA replication and repair protein RecF [Rhodospirillaceae bacterium LM-1]
MSALKSISSLAVVRLRLTGFRSYGHLALDPEKRPVALFGPNGAGKTNLLEAVSLLAPGRGLRRARPLELAQKDGNGGWAVAASLVCGAERYDVGTGFEPGDGERRQVRIDGQSARGATALSGFSAAVWLTPAMDRLLAEGPGARRKLLDRVAFGFDPGHAGRVTAYEKAMSERARLLTGQGMRADAAWLSGLEEIMAAKGVAVAAARREAVKRLQEAMAQGPDSFPRPQLGLAGSVEEDLQTSPAVEVEDKLRDGLQRARQRDREYGGASLGPHRSDLVVRHAAKDMSAALCSTGEQKALLVSLVLGWARALADSRGFVPLVLLDEVAAHLDELRRAQLFEALDDLGAQTWATGTDAHLFSAWGGRAQLFRVEAGRAILMN